MALTLDATVGTPTSNAYCDVDFLRDYFANHWSLTKRNLIDGMSDEALGLLIIVATQAIDQYSFTANGPIYDQRSSIRSDLEPWIQGIDYFAYYALYPVKCSPEQRLQFPRNKDVDPETMQPFIPEKVQIATCEEVVYLAALDESALVAQRQGIKSEQMSVGGGSFSQSIQYTGDGTQLAPLAYEMLKSYVWTPPKSFTR